MSYFRIRKKNKNCKKYFSDPFLIIFIVERQKIKISKHKIKKRNVAKLKSVYNFFKIKELPENMAPKLSSFDLDLDDNNIDNENDNNIGSKKQEDISKITQLSEEPKKNIIDIIKEDKVIYDKILLFKQISLKEIKGLLNSKQIIIVNLLLSKLLINSGVIVP